MTFALMIPDCGARPLKPLKINMLINIETYCSFHLDIYQKLSPGVERKVCSVACSLMSRNMREKNDNYALSYLHNGQGHTELLAPSFSFEKISSDLTNS